MIAVIDGVKCAFEKGETLLAVALRNGVKIPTLCHYNALPGLACCRVCMVELNENGWKRIVAACVFPLSKDCEVETNSDDIRRMRKTLLKLMINSAPGAPPVKKLCDEYGVEYGEIKPDDEKCVMCGLCVVACAALGPSAIAMMERGVAKKVSTPYDEPGKPCIGCASCAMVCPSGAIGIDESGGKRTIWGKTFDMQPCGKCGELFATVDEYEYAVKKGGSQMDAPLCKECRRESIAGVFARDRGV